MRYWLLKTEPNDYSFADLQRDGVAEWDGVTSNPAQANMRQMAEADICVIYHTGDERRAVGLAAVARGPYPDPADPGGKRVLVDLRATEPLANPVPLSDLKGSPLFADAPLVRMGRLSVVPLTEEQFRELLRMSRA
jgi:predicted RNA-binding protein with PUA-like domain